MTIGGSPAAAFLVDASSQQIARSDLVNDIEIAKAQRDFQLKKAAYDQEIQTKVLLVRQFN